MRKPDTDETIGNNVHGIRIARRISMQEAVNGMRELGHSWSKTGSARVFAHFGLRPSPWR